MLINAHHARKRSGRWFLRHARQITEFIIWLRAINKVYECMILGVKYFSIFSMHTLWANAISMYNVKFRLLFSGTLRSKPIKIHFFSRDSNICVDMCTCVHTSTYIMWHFEYLISNLAHYLINYQLHTCIHINEIN